MDVSWTGRGGGTYVVQSTEMSFAFRSNYGRQKCIPCIHAINHKTMGSPTLTSATSTEATQRDWCHLASGSTLSHRSRKWRKKEIWGEDQEEEKEKGERERERDEGRKDLLPHLDIVLATFSPLSFSDSSPLFSTACLCCPWACNTQIFSLSLQQRERKAN